MVLIGLAVRACAPYSRTRSSAFSRKNEADQRVFQLLSERFQLFEGVFGASDEVLGAIESGADFEKLDEPEDLPTVLPHLSEAPQASN